ncbi:MAG: GGDEF domain-containing protein [Burkholderiales bacterium]|nr:GGDEF domain-containing protein [Burkholderiales bacterium]
MIRPRLSRTRAGDDAACPARPMPMADVRVPQSVRTSRPDAPPDIAIEDWDELFSAVKARLRRVVGERTQPLSEAQARLAEGQVRTSVLECADALDQLHMTLRHELGRRQRLDLARFEAPAVSAQARVEPSGARAEDPRPRQPAPQPGPTESPDGSAMRQRLDHELAVRASRPDRVAVLRVELDGVAPIDRAHGRAVGDELRCVVAARLNRALRADDLVCQTAADEFGCAVTDLPGRAALVGVACKLFDALSAPFQIGTLRFTVRPSIGMATGSANATAAEDLLRNAGIAMALARRQHTGHAFFEGCGDARGHDTNGSSPSSP